MKNLQPCNLALVLFLVLFVAGYNLGQTTTKGDKPHISLDGLYSVTVPDGIRVGGGGPLEAAFTEGFGSGYSTYWSTPNVELQAGYMRFPKDRTGSAESVNDGLLLQAAARLKQLQTEVPGFTAVNDRRINVNKVPTIELTFKDESRDVIYRLFRTEAGIVRLMAVLSSNVEQERAMMFLNSLQVLSRDEIIRRKVLSATPKSLPECGPKSGLQTGVLDLGLGGKVKAIVVEREEVKDGVPTRWPSEQSFFDASGRLVRAIVYENGGRPSLVRVYGCIDDKKVWQTGYVPYENILTGMAPARPGARPRDLRYSMAYELETGSGGRIAKMTVTRNDLLVDSTTTVEYSAGKVVRTTLDENGKLELRIVEDLDKNGLLTNVSSERIGSNGWAWKNTYKVTSFDAKQNWTRRSGVYQRIVNGVIEHTSEFQEIRTISYFE